MFESAAASSFFSSISASHLASVQQKYHSLVDQEASEEDITQWAIRTLASYAALLDSMAEFEAMPEVAKWCDKLRVQVAPKIACEKAPVSQQSWLTFLPRVDPVEGRLCARCGRTGHGAVTCSFYSHNTKTSDSGGKVYLIQEKWLSPQAKGIKAPQQGFYSQNASQQQQNGVWGNPNGQNTAQNVPHPPSVPYNQGQQHYQRR